MLAGFFWMKMAEKADRTGCRRMGGAQYAGNGAPRPGLGFHLANTHRHPGPCLDCAARSSSQAGGPCSSLIDVGLMVAPYGGS